MRKILLSSAATLAALSLMTASGQLALAQDNTAAGEAPAVEGTQAPTAEGGQAQAVEGADAPAEQYRSARTADGAETGLPEELTSDEIVGAEVYDAQGEEIGEVVDLLLDENVAVQKVLIDVGGFLGIGAHRVALDVAEISFTEPDGGYLRGEVDVTREALEQMPAFEPADEESWVAVPMPTPASDGMGTAAPGETGMATAPGAAPDAPAGEAGSYRSWDQAGTDDMTVMGDLSAKAVLGSTVYDAEHEPIGEVSDLLIGEDDSIERLLVDVGGFLGIGSHSVALSIDQTERAEIDGQERIVVALSEAELEAMPAAERNQSGDWLAR